MNIQLLKTEYGERLTNHLLDILFDTPVHELIEEWLYYIPKDELNKIMEDINLHMEEKDE
jgi:hypothetical protein